MKTKILIALSLVLASLLIAGGLKTTLKNANAAGITENEYWQFNFLQTKSALFYGGIGSIVVLMWALYLKDWKKQPQPPKTAAPVKRRSLFEEDDGTHLPERPRAGHFDHRKWP